MANGVALREEIEKRGGKVTWQGAGKPIKVELGGKTFDIQDYSVVGGKAQVSPETLSKLTGYQPVRSTLEGRYEVGWDPKAGQVTVKDPLTGKSATVTPQAVWGGRSYVSPEKVEEVKRQLATPWEEAARKSEEVFKKEYEPAVREAYETWRGEMGRGWQEYEQGMRREYENYSAEVRRLTDSYIEGINSIAAQLSDAGLRALNAYQQQFSQAVGLLQQYLQRQPEIPASVKLALEEVKKAVDENAKALAEEMNRRGILQSGLAFEEERKLREKGLTEQEKILAQWLDQEHENMMRAVFELANMYATSAGPLAELQYRALAEPLQMRTRGLETLYKTGTELASAGYGLGTELLGKRLGLAEQLATKGLEFATGLAEERYKKATELAEWLAEQEREAYKAVLEKRAKDAELAWELQSKLWDLAQKEADRALRERSLAETIRHHKAIEDIQRTQGASGASSLFSDILSAVGGTSGAVTDDQARGLLQRILRGE